MWGCFDARCRSPPGSGHQRSRHCRPSVGRRSAAKNGLYLDELNARIESKNDAPRPDAAPERTGVLPPERNDIPGKRIGSHGGKDGVDSLLIVLRHAPKRSGRRITELEVPTPPVDLRGS